LALALAFIVCAFRTVSFASTIATFTALISSIMSGSEYGLSASAVEIGRVFGFLITNSMVVSWVCRSRADRLCPLCHSTHGPAMASFARDHGAYKQHR
jgi:predicted membrane chloride channel (bestrophin family)